MIMALHLLTSSPSPKTPTLLVVACESGHVLTVDVMRETGERVLQTISAHDNEPGMCLSGIECIIAAHLLT